MRDPHLFHQIERLHAFGKDLAHDDRDVCLCGPLIFTQLGQPPIAPIFRALCFPQDPTAGLARRPHDVLHQISAVLALRHWLDRVVRKFGAKQRFQVQFQHFAL